MVRRVCMFLGCLLLLTVSITGCSDKKEEEAELKEKVETVKEQIEEEKTWESFVYEEVEGGVAITKYSGQGSDVEIPEEIDGKKVVEIREDTFPGTVVIESLKIPPTIQKIGTSQFSESVDIKILGYRNTAAIDYAQYRGHSYEILGENPVQASTVKIYDTSGRECKIMKPGDTGADGYTKGISFVEKDGKSVLTLNGCIAGSIVVEEYASLTIELIEGSENVLTTDEGLDGISINGNLTITGNGSLKVAGSDYSSVREGESGSVGEGIFVYGDLVIEDHANVAARCGSCEFLVSNAVCVYSGNVTVKDSATLEMIATTDADDYAVSVFDNGTRKYGQIVLDGKQIQQGGVVSTICYSNGEDVNYDTPIGATISSHETVVMDYEGMITGAATYVLIQ